MYCIQESEWAWTIVVTLVLALLVPVFYRRDHIRTTPEVTQLVVRRLAQQQVKIHKLRSELKRIVNVLVEEQYQSSIRLEETLKLQMSPLPLSWNPSSSPLSAAVTPTLSFRPLVPFKPITPEVKGKSLKPHPPTRAKSMDQAFPRVADQIKHHDADLEALEEENRHLMLMFDLALAADLEKMQNQTSTSTVELLSSSQDELKTVIMQNECLKADVEDLRHERTQLENLHHNMVETVDTLTLKYNNVCEEYDQLTSHVETLERCHEEEQSKLEMHLHIQAQNYQRDIQYLEAMTTEMGATVENLWNKFKREQEENITLQAQVSLLNAKIDALKQHRPLTKQPQAQHSPIKGQMNIID